MRRTKLRPISQKRAAQLPEYNALIKKLRTLCGNKSELDGSKPDWQSGYVVDPHHILGRGKHFLDPFSIIMLTRTQHDTEEGKIKGVKYGEALLLKLVQAIRIKQGFNPSEWG